MKRELTCIVCPIGCNLSAEFVGENVIEVKGNSCPRGKVYAETECVAPMRTITTTVRCKNGSVIPVKTEKPIDKDKIFECMKILNSVICDLPISVGDVIMENVCGSRIVATKNVLR